MRLSERARQLASMPDVTLCTFGDLMRVPGANGSLEEARTRSGADIRVIYSPWDALNMAEVEPGQRFVFLGVGFETTAPLTAATIQAAKKREIENFFVLSAHKTMPATMRALAARRGDRLAWIHLPRPCQHDHRHRAPTASWPVSTINLAW